MADSTDKPEQFYCITVEKLMTAPYPEAEAMGLRQAICVAFSGVLSQTEFEDSNLQFRLLEMLRNFPDHSKQTSDVRAMTKEEAQSYLQSMVGENCDPTSLQQNFVDDDAPPRRKMN